MLPFPKFYEVFKKLTLLACVNISALVSAGCHCTGPDFFFLLFAMEKPGNHSSAVNINTSCWSEDHMKKECAVGVRVGPVVVVGGALNGSGCPR